MKRKMLFVGAMMRCPGGSRSCDHTAECFAAQDRAIKTAISRQSKSRRGKRG